MTRSLLRRLLTVGVGLALIWLVHPLSYLTEATQQNTCRTFRETGKTVCGKFLSYWNDHGGLPLFGYPISNPLTEKSSLDNKDYVMQYFERAVFEHHPENKPPYDVLLSQLGTYRLMSSYPQGEPDPPYVENLPIYHNALNIKVVRGTGADKNITTYTTLHTTDAVLDFYKDVLTRNGWALEKQRYSDALAFSYTKKPDGAVYGIYVVATSSGANRTSVTVRLQITYPR